MASYNLVEETEKVNSDLKAANLKIKKSEEGVSAAASSQVTVPIGKQWWRADEAMTISASVLIFGVLVMVLMTISLRKTNLNPDSILRLFGTIIIIVGALFLIVAGYTETQMGPVMGLLGTIAGYLLGKNSTLPAVFQKNDA